MGNASICGLDTSKVVCRDALALQHVDRPLAHGVRPLLIEQLSQDAAKRTAGALTRRRRTAHTACAPHQTVGVEYGETRPMLSFCSNDYLGLANHPAVIAAFAEGAQRYGTGSGASHLVNGHSLAHHQVETELACWLSPYIPEVQALYFCTGYMANVAVLSALGTADATLFCEKLTMPR